MSGTRSVRSRSPSSTTPSSLGDFAERQAADRRALEVAIAAAIGIFLLLQAALGSWRLAAVSFLVLPLAMVGCVLAAGRGGFRRLARFGRGLRHGLRDQHAGRHHAAPPLPATRAGRRRRLRGGASSNAVRASDASRSWRPRSRPALALLPFALSGSVAGQEITHPMAIIDHRRSHHVDRSWSSSSFRTSTCDTGRRRPPSPRRPRSWSSRRSSPCRRADATRRKKMSCVQEGSSRRSSSWRSRSPGVPTRRRRMRAARADVATVEPIEGSDVARVTLSKDAAGRLDITTAPITELGGSKARTAIPYAAVLYDPNGVHVGVHNPSPLVFVRAPITVVTIDGEPAPSCPPVPPAGTPGRDGGSGRALRHRVRRRRRSERGRADRP